MGKKSKAAPKVEIVNLTNRGIVFNLKGGKTFRLNSRERKLIATKDISSEIKLAEAQKQVMIIVLSKGE